MSALHAHAPAGALPREVLAHLEEQIASARRLLGQILAQGAAIRGRDVDAVLERMTEIQAEMTRRGSLEMQRADLLTRAGQAIGIPAGAVTLEALTRLMDERQAELARERSAELRGLLGEIAREHGLNRALMRQELAFLEHLTRLIGQTPDAGYRPTGPRIANAYRVLDLQA